MINHKTVISTRTIYIDGSFDLLGFKSDKFFFIIPRNSMAIEDYSLCETQRIGWFFRSTRRDQDKISAPKTVFLGPVIFSQSLKKKNIRNRDNKIPIVRYNSFLVLYSFV
jgi:hypothetical protein